MSKQKDLEESLRELKKIKSAFDFLMLLKTYRQIIKGDFKVSHIFREEETDTKYLINKLKLLFGQKLSTDAVENQSTSSTGSFKMDVDELQGATVVCYKDMEEKLLNIFKASEVNSRSFSEALKSLLCELQSEDCNLEEALGKIIKETEVIITKSRMYCKYSSKPQFREAIDTKILKIGICITSQFCDAKACEVLDLTLLIGDGHRNFSESEKKIIGELMNDAVVPIQRHIRRVFYSYGCSTYASIKKKKTALEIIFEDYNRYLPLSVRRMSEYPTLIDSIELLDEVKREYCDSSYGESD